ncbi:hypothetical protein ACWGFX_02625 [Streptomyces xanthophaeus]|uniref:hypothetical protein n=1 Tax=Streptomyces xanthophaeus TaxID=67385 RepID=UPI001F487926|nr:hypothetical protein [Streptomyces xanthophaeus]
MRERRYTPPPYPPTAATASAVARASTEATAVAPAAAVGGAVVSGAGPLPSGLAVTPPGCALGGGERTRDRPEHSARYDWAHAVIARAAPPGAAGRPARPTLTDRADRLLLSRCFGIPFFLAVMWGVFQASTTLAKPLQDGLGALAGGPVSGGAGASSPPGGVRAPARPRAARPARSWSH